MVNVDDIMRKYGRKIEGEVCTSENYSNQDFSREYKQFKVDMMPNLSRYERWCQTIGNLFTIRVAEKDQRKIQKFLDIAHLDVNPNQVLTLALLSLLLTFFVGVLICLGIFLILDSFPFILFFLFIMTALFLFYYTYGLPMRMANSWRLKASSQMVPAILYVVVYMKHTSNLERAVRFASQHLQVPLALDFRKIFWDVETGRFSSVKESLDNYLESWRDYSMEFIESFHLIESSLYEPDEERRIATLEKSLQVILDGVYDKMLKYTHEVKSPLTNLYMLGIILPTLGLALLPLASTLLQGMIKWYHVFLGFNILIPFFVFYLTNEVMIKRPGGYGETDILEMNPLYKKYKSKKPYLIAFLICFPLLLIGVIPFLFQFTGLPGLLGLQRDYTFNELGFSFFGDMRIFDFKGNTGPFGAVALLLSLFIPLSLALFFILSFNFKTKELIKARDYSKSLEKEFVGSLFQLGNRIGDGLPAEIAFTKVAESTKGTRTENFFRIVNQNIQSLGMSLDDAIFNPKRGAIIFYPSALISTSMRILVESVKKGLEVAARSLMSISEYVKNIHKINQRLKDLLAEIVSDMKSNMTFLAPLLAGIVVGLSSMITLILSKLEETFSGLEAGGEFGFAGMDVLGLFDVKLMIPPYYLQIAIGIYIIQIIFILTSTLVTIDAGEDKLKKIHDIGRNLKIGVLLYIVVAVVAIVALSVLAAVALSGLTFS